MAAPSAGQGRQGQAAQAARPFEAIMPRVAATAPGTYVVSEAELTPAPEAARIPVLVQADVLRGPENTTRVAIVVGAQASKAVDVRLRVWTVAAGQQPGRVVADAGGSGAAGPMRLVREFNLAPGDYDLEAVVGHPDAGKTTIAGIAKARLNVPDVRGSLAVTPVVAGEASNGSSRTDVPFIFGQTTIAPAVSPRFPQDGTISVAFRIYNWSAKPEEKPDLLVEYLFYEQGTKGLHFFNKTKPQQLTAGTLGTAFDPSVGSVTAGKQFPLAAFTFGEFQLTVRVTDNRTKQTADRQLRFTVAP